MNEITVLVRIALYILVGRMMAGGWIPEEMAEELLNPAMVEMISAAVLALIAGGWYKVSEARRVLKVPKPG